LGFYFHPRKYSMLQAVLHFIYRDNLVNDDELSASSSDCSIFDRLSGKLMAAADKYELPRLRLLCESYLCKHISVNSVATTLALADRHHAMELKSVCLKFAAENLSGNKTRHEICLTFTCHL
jgi:speckle-type POZ protein